jgi:uncharacterized protein (TIGR02246 family)
MKRALLRFLVAGAVVVGVILSGCASTGTSVTPSDLADARALNQKFAEAMNRKDLDGAMSCFWNSPDLILVLWGTTVRGYEGVRAGIKQMFDQNESVKLEVNELTFVPVGDMIMAVGTATYYLQPKSGPSQKIVERWTDLERKIDGRWVYVMDHATIVPG